MSQQITKIKARIKTVSSALKVTSAMKLVSTVKLNRYKNRMLNNRVYAQKIDNITDEVLKWTKTKNKYFVENEDTDKKLYLIISSTLGLCGAYNSNIFRLADSVIGKDDELVIIGKKGLTHYQNGEHKLILDFNEFISMKNEKAISDIVDFIIDKFLSKQFKEIHLIYSSYRNSMVFVPKDYLVLPIRKEVKEDELGFAPILEPTEEILIDTLVPLYLKTSVFSKFLESEVCEQAARCNAMESATDNANEILDALNIEFNKARQASITQEITEIVGAAEAL